jgi:hypothetical protein
VRTWFVALTILGLLSTSFADDFVSSQSSRSSPQPNKSANKSTKKSGPNATKPVAITAEREAAAMSFVKEHHAELAELLIHLKDSSPKEYERAIRDLSRASERLTQIRERDSQAYELELKVWQARSRAQLLNARLQMTEDEEIRKKLRETLTEEYDLRLLILTRDRDRLVERTKNLDEQIERLKQRRDDGIEAQYQQLTKAARKANVKKPQSKAKTQVKDKK